MKTILAKDLENITGGVMQHPDCDDWFFEATFAIADADLETAYEYVSKMKEGGCVNPLQDN